jgi:hypothetical protein
LSSRGLLSRSHSPYSWRQGGAIARRQRGAPGADRKSVHDYLFALYIFFFVSDDDKVKGDLKLKNVLKYCFTLYVLMKTRVIDK